MKKVLTHESGSHPQGLNSKLKQFNNFSAGNIKSTNIPLEDLWAHWGANSRCPNKSFDNGWGLGQQTNPIPEKQLLWDWRANVDDTYERYLVKRGEMMNKLDDYLDIIILYENQHGDTIKVSGHDDFEDGITWVHSLSTIFEGLTNYDDHFDQIPEEGQVSFLDAMLLKRYNGLGNVGSPNYDKDYYYLVYNPNNPESVPTWYIDNTAHYKDENGNWVAHNYVNRIATTAIPQN